MADTKEQWFEYDWPMEGAMARFGVDMALVDSERFQRPLLLYVSCQSLRKEAKELSSVEAAMASALLRRICRRISPLYAGFIEVDAQIQYYFYIHDKREFTQAAELAKKEPFLTCQAGLAREEDWLTYSTLLYPDAAKLQTEQNLKHLELMQKHGDCMSAVRRVSFTLYFATESVMLTFAEQARLSGFAFSGPVYAPERELAYGAAIVRLSTLKKADIDALTTKVINLAQPYGGELGEWDSPIIRRGGPLMQQH